APCVANTVYPRAGFLAVLRATAACSRRFVPSAAGTPRAVLMCTPQGGVLVSNSMLERWKPEAYALEQYLDQLPAPLPFLVNEASDVGWFCEMFWEPEVGADGAEIRPGLCSVERPRLFERRIGAELLELQEALQAASSDYRALSRGGEYQNMDRALFVLNELQEVLMFLAYEDPK